jgi:hypothetical protein
VVENYTYKNVIEFKAMDQDMLGEFQGALDKYETFRENQLKTATDLTITEPIIITSALPPFEKTMRSSGGMNTTMSGNQSENSKSPRDRSSLRNSRSMKGGLSDDPKRRSEQALKDAEEAQKFLEDDMAELEFENGV